MKRPTQHQRLLEAFQKAPEHKLSMRYVKREMGISEANGRLSELRDMGYVIEPVGKDEFGFAIQQLKDVPKRKVSTFEPVLDESGRQIAVREVVRFV